MQSVSRETAITAIQEQDDEGIIRLYGFDDQSQWLDFLDWESLIQWRQSFEPTTGGAHHVQESLG